MTATKGSSESEADELILIGENIYDVGTILQNEHPKPASIRILNLHGNIISNVCGLQSSLFQGLTELNLSSNAITSCNLPELSFLSKLEVLDLSANLISTTNGFPFMSSLKKLWLSYNRCSDLDELGHSLPSLEFIDIRNNLIYDVCQMNSLCLSKQLNSVHIGGGFSPNPVSGIASEMMKLFDSIPTLVDIDDENFEFWKNKENQSTNELTNSIVSLLDKFHNKTIDANECSRSSTQNLNSQQLTVSNISSVGEILVPTPKFNFLLECFKARTSQKIIQDQSSQHPNIMNLNSNSKTDTVHPNQAIRSKIDNFLNKKFKNDLLRISSSSQLPTEVPVSSSSSSSNIIIHDAINQNHSSTASNSHENKTQFMYMNEVVTHATPPSRNEHNNSKFKAPSSDYADMNDKSTSTDDKLLTLAKVYFKYNLDKHADKIKMQYAFQKLSHVALLRSAYLRYDNLLTNALQEKIEISNRQSAEVKEMQDYCHRCHRESKMALEICYHKIIKLESLNNGYVNSLQVNEVIHQRKLQEKQTKIEELQTLLEEEQRNNLKMEESLSDFSTRYDVLLNSYNTSKQEYEIKLLKEQNEFDKYMQLHVSEENRMKALELDVEKLTQLQIMSDASYQAEIALLTQKNVEMENEWTILEGKLNESLNTNEILRANIEQLNLDKMNGETSFSHQLATLGKEIEAYKERNRHLEAQRHKHIKIIDQTSALLRKQKQELLDSQNRENNLHQQITDITMTFNMNIANQNTNKHDYQLIVHENESLKAKIEHLKHLYKTSEEEKSVATLSNHPKEAYDTSALYDRMRIKDKMLDDQNALVQDLRDKVGNYDKQIKTLKRDLKETESFLEEAKTDINDLETQLKIKHEIEQNLNELISQQQQQIQQQLSSEESSRICKHCNHPLVLTLSMEHFNIFDEDSSTSRNGSPPVPSSSASSKSNSLRADEIIRLQNLENELIQSQQKLLSEQESKRHMETELQTLHSQKNQEIIQLEMKLAASESEQQRLLQCVNEEKMRYSINLEHSRTERKKLQKHIKKLEVDLHSKDSQHIEAKKILLACLNNI